MTGGDLVSGTLLKSVEIYDPAAGFFTSVAISRSSQTATLLPDGRVLIVGGDPTLVPGESVTTTAELYDPSTNSFSRTGRPIAGQQGAI